MTESYDPARNGAENDPCHLTAVRLGRHAQLQVTGVKRCPRIDPAAVVHHDYAAVVDKRFLDRHTLWHARGMARFLRKHPERLLALR